MRQLGIVRLGDRCLTHDFYIQIGIHSHSLERHRELCPDIDWVETYWYPDKFAIRYARVTYQRTMACNEGSPRTDNAGDNRPRDFPHS